MSVSKKKDNPQSYFFETDVIMSLGIGSRAQSKSSFMVNQSAP
jgi:HKD family nuclease